MIPCECYNPRWEPYEDPQIAWDYLGRPEHITEFLVCMNCDRSWTTRYLIENIDEITIADMGEEE